MICPRCNGDTKVADKRDGKGNTNRRRRECLGCGYRFNTREFVEQDMKNYVARLKKRLEVIRILSNTEDPEDVREFQDTCLYHSDDEVTDTLPAESIDPV